MTIRFGIGIDVHRLVSGHQLILGGVLIDSRCGLRGHSDGDVLIHSIIDAILGAAGLGDIGTHFPSDDVIYKGIDSTILLSETIEIITKRNWRLQYVDATMIAEQPRLQPYVKEIRETLSKALKIPDKLINVKATTTDGIGFTGRGEGIASLAIATLNEIQ